MEDLIRKQHLTNVAVFSLASESGYQGLPSSVHRRGWWAVIVSDLYEDIRAMLLTNAKDQESAMAEFGQCYDMALEALATGSFKALEKKLRQGADRLHRIPLNQPVERVPVILLSGEIFVRRDSLSRQQLTEQLARRGFATICTPVAEWIHYVDCVAAKGMALLPASSLRSKLSMHIRRHFMLKDEQRIHHLLSASGLVLAAPVQIEPIIDTAQPYISPYLNGEAILTVGSAIHSAATEACGVIAIGPFGCMPNRLSEAILNEFMKRDYKLASSPNDRTLAAVLADIETLPFLAIESDGSPFPQLQHARLEAFCLQAIRLHQRMLRYKYAN